MLELFGDVIAEGGSGVVIASQSGHRLPPLSVEQNRALAMTPTEDLLDLDFLQEDRVTDSLNAYQLSKRGNALRVAADAVRLGQAGRADQLHQSRHHHDAFGPRRTQRPAITKTA